MWKIIQNLPPGDHWAVRCLIPQVVAEGTTVRIRRCERRIGWDTRLYEANVLRAAVKLHPRVVVIGVLVGAMLLGPALLVIPAITLVRELAATIARHLSGYGLL